MKNSTESPFYRRKLILKCKTTLGTFQPTQEEISVPFLIRFVSIASKIYRRLLLWRQVIALKAIDLIRKWPPTDAKNVKLNPVWNNNN